MLPLKDIRRLAALGRAAYHRRAAENDPSREVFAPRRDVYPILESLVEPLREALPQSEYGHAVPGRSIITHAARHVGMQLVLTADVVDYFGCVTRPVVRRLFAGTHLPVEMVDVVAPVWCRGLPQGSPLSAVVAEAAGCFVDEVATRAAGLATQLVSTYSRYVDDVAWSFDTAPECVDLFGTSFLSAIAVALLANGFPIGKFRVMPFWRRQEVTGLLVNGERVRAPREMWGRLRAMAHELEMTSCVLDEEARAELQMRVDGMLAFLRQIDPEKVARLEEKEFTKKLERDLGEGR